MAKRDHTYVRPHQFRPEQESEPIRNTELWPGGTFSTEEVRVPDNPLYNTLADPTLNRGLEQILQNARDVLFGRESENALVDYGVSNVPGLGPVVVAATGGMPGLVDATGLGGGLRNAKKLTKATIDFVSKHYGPRGLRALDNALTKYPKAEKPSVRDAIYILQTGLGGEIVPATKSYQVDAVDGLQRVVSAANPDDPASLYDDVQRYASAIADRYAEGTDSRAFAERMLNEFNDAVATNDFNKLYSRYAALENMAYDDALPRVKAAVKKADQSATPLTDAFANRSADKTAFKIIIDPDNPAWPILRHITDVRESPLQNWDALVRAQERRDARKAKNAPVQTAAEEAVAKYEPKHGDEYYSVYGRNLSDDSKRSLDKVDSIADVWANRLFLSPKFENTPIRSKLDAARLRHDREASNYNAISRQFRNDIQRNIESGNIPQKVQMGPKYDVRGVEQSYDTPYLLIDLLEAPRNIPNPRMWPDMADGPDLYETVMRPKVERRMKEKNPDYPLSPGIFFKR